MQPPSGRSRTRALHAASFDGLRPYDALTVSPDRNRREKEMQKPNYTWQQLSDAYAAWSRLISETDSHDYECKCESCVTCEELDIINCLFSQDEHATAIIRINQGRGGELINPNWVEQSKPRTRFCWHCSRQFRGSHYATHVTDNGTVYVHKDCKRILEGGFNHVRAVDDKGGAELQSEFIRG
jgi:hypothetical protein